MLALLLGFIAPFIPDLLGIGKAHLDYIQERAMMKLRLQGENQAASWRMEETLAKADESAFVIAHKQYESFGIKLLDAGKMANGKLPWYLVPVAWAFAFVDFMNAFIRPGITMWFLGFYLATKWARVQLAITALGGGDLSDDTIWANALTAVWDADDKEILNVIIGFWFGKMARSTTQFAKI